MAQAKELEKYKDYIRSKILPDNQPAISVSDRGVLHVDSSFVLTSETGAKQLAAAIRLKKAIQKRA